MASGLSLNAIAFMTAEEAGTFAETLMRTGKFEIGTANFKLVINLKRPVEEIKREAATEADVMTEDEDSDANLNLSTDTRFTATPPQDDPYWLSASFHEAPMKVKKQGNS